VPAHGRQAIHAGEPLQLRLGRRLEREFPRALGKLADERRDQDLGSARLRGDPCGQDDGLSEEVVGLLGRFSGVQADPKAQVRTFVAAILQRSLDPDGA
jgi:hypothetical protein